MRIAIFQSEWPAMLHTAAFVTWLARQGHEVDLWLHDAPFRYIDPIRLKATPGVKVRELWKGLLTSSATRAAIRACAYNLVIGIEKGGLIWASAAAKLLGGVPLWYYSLEIYLEDHQMAREAHFARLRRREIRAHAGAALTIIQDASRYHALLAANRAVQPAAFAGDKPFGGAVAYLPVSVSRTPETLIHDYFHRQFALPPATKIVLYFGLVAKNRGVLELAKAAADLDDGIVLVLHGPREDGLDELDAYPGKVFVSSVGVPEEQISQLITSAHVGIALYNDAHVNDRLTAKSSEKVARYLQCGVPFIARDNESYRALKAEFDCCELIGHTGDLAAAVRRIDANYASYRRNAVSAFNLIFDFDRNIESLKVHLDAVAASARPRPPSNAKKPQLSVVLPTYNRASLLKKALLSLSHQTFRPDSFEVIVVDNGSTDDTAATCALLAPLFSRFKVIHDSRPGLHVGRHRGLEVAEAPIVVYGDDDIEAMPTWLEGIAEAFEDPGTGLVGGPIAANFEADRPGWVGSLVDPVPYGWTLGAYSILDFGPEMREIQPGHVYGCNFSIRKDLLRRLGGFHPDAMPSNLIRYRGDGVSGISPGLHRLGRRAVYHPKAAICRLVSREHLSAEYIHERVYRQGISDSYSLIRRSGGLPPLDSLPIPELPRSGVPPMRQLAQFALRQGFLYHQNEVRNDAALLSWVLRPTYLGDDDAGQTGEAR